MLNRELGAACIAELRVRKKLAKEGDSLSVRDAVREARRMRPAGYSFARYAPATDRLTNKAEWRELGVGDADDQPTVLAREGHGSLAVDRSREIGAGFRRQRRDVSCRWHDRRPACRTLQRKPPPGCPGGGVLVAGGCRG